MFCILVKFSHKQIVTIIANEIILSPRNSWDQQVLLDTLQHLSIISDKAIKGNEGELNTFLLGRVILFFNVLPPSTEEDLYEFDHVTELSKLLEKCLTETQNNSHYSPRNMEACITTISETAPPVHCLQVLSQWGGDTAIIRELSSSSVLVSALQTCLIRGAREGVRNEFSGSLLRIQRAREEGRRPNVVANGMLTMNSWSIGTEEGTVVGDDGEEEDMSGKGFVWPNVLDGSLEISK